MKVATVCTGIGSPEQALKNMGIYHEIVFGCEIDKNAKQTYLANFNPGFMEPDMTKCDWEGEKYYADLFVGGIPCQAFSLAGKRLGELDPRGLLFYDFYKYVKVQQPKYFIIENVKGLLSDQNGNTFNNWLQLLGRSVNTLLNMFNHPDSLEYNLHWTVLNTKDFGLPQNRERVFIVGIRKDLPNTFRFPIGWRLDKRLKDVLEENVDEKYYLSEKYINSLITHSDRHQRKGNGFKFEPTDGDCVASAITTKAGQRTTDNYIQEPALTQIGQLDGFESSGRIYDENGISCTIKSQGGGGGAKTGWYQTEEPVCVAMRGRNPENSSDRTTGAPTQQRLEPNSQGITNTITSVQKDNFVIVQEATNKGYDIAKEGNSINLSNPNSKTRIGRVGKGIANTLDTACNQAVVSTRIRRLTPLECFRLQGFPDEFFYKSKYESKEFSQKILLKYPNHKGKRIFTNEERIERMSDTQLYKQAGNTISVPVIQAILERLLK